VIKIDREAIVSMVREETRIKTTRATTIIQNNIDQVQDLHIANNIFEHQFSWLKEYGYLNLVPIYETGTVAVTQDSTTVTGTTTVWTSTHVGWIFKIDDADEYYEVSAVGGNTDITLKSAYIGATAATQGYKLYKVYYDLASDFDSMRWIKQLVSPTRISPAEDLSFQTLSPNDFEPSGDITSYIIGSIKSDVMQIRFSPIQTIRKRLYYCYDKSLATINTTGASSILPSKWHWLFVHKLSEILFDAHDMTQKARIHEAKFNAMLKTFVNKDVGMKKDRKNVVADEKLYKGNNTPYAHLPSQYSEY
jgi:hypothetical protein